MQEILFLRGLPASGKTTFALDFIEKNPNYRRINKDDIRAKYSEKWSSEFEKKVLKEQRLIGNHYLEEGYSLIVDDTNYSTKHEVYWSEIAKIKNIKFTIKEFRVSVDECIRRDALRENPVGEKVIKRINHQRKNLPKRDNRFILEQDIKLEHIIICDIDGTLALMNGRNPYIPNETDLINPYVKNILDCESNINTTIILLSGRSEEYREVTEKWLNDHNVYYDKLIMRKQYDNRPDEIIKKEIYDNEIKNNYYVKYILDDRNKVVDMWRNEGLLCLQVYYGDF